MDGVVVVLAAARPGPLLDGLLAVLNTIPRIGITDGAHDLVSALRMVSEHRPTVVLIDCDLPGDQAQAVLQRIKVQSPATRCIILADSVQERRAALAVGADAVLLKGCLAVDLVATVESLLA